MYKKNYIYGSVFFVMVFCSIWNVSIYIIAFFCIISFFYLPLKRYMDRTFFMLFLFSFFYVLLLLLQGNVVSWFSLFSYLIAPLIFYSLGGYVVDCCSYPKQIVAFIFILILLYSLVLYISAFIDIIDGGFLNINRSFSVYNIYDGADELSLNATLYGLVASLGLSGFGWFFVRNIGSLSIRVGFLFLSIFSLITVLHLINRTGIVVFIASFLSVIIFCFKKKIHILFAICVVFVVVLVSLFYFNVLDQTILDAYVNRNQNIGQVQTFGGRTDKWFIGIQNLIDYPFGWYDSAHPNFVHNLWLDIARVGGVIPFVFFTLATVFSYSRMIKLLKLNEIQISPLLLGLNVCFLLSSMVEPVIEAMPLYFYLYILLWGMQNRIYENEKESKCKKTYKCVENNRVEIWG